VPSSPRFEGFIDIHAHADPDRTRRSLDVIELARQYHDRGFRGLLLMNHHDSTAGQAYLVSKVVPGIEVYGGIVLNHLIGGLNLHAVEHFTQVEGGLGKVVYMPTTGSENEVRWNGSGGPFVSISEGGRLLPEVYEVLDLVAELDLALSTGHSSSEEVLLLTQAARERGIERILATNPTYPAIDMSVEQMVEAARLGATIEFIYYVLGTPGTRWTIEGYARAIQAIGVERCILSSCGGQAWMPIHTFAWSELIGGLLEHGITQGEIDTMAKLNPARLLGIE
jgi:hypothetical protein